MKQSRSENQQIRKNAQTPFECGDGGCLILLGIRTKREKRERHGETFERHGTTENLIIRAIKNAPFK